MLTYILIKPLSLKLGKCLIILAGDRNRTDDRLITNGLSNHTRKFCYCLVY